MEKDADNNVLVGNVINMNSKNCYIESYDKLIATINLDNIVVVESCNSLLICDKNKTQDVKLITDYLKKNEMEEYKIHKKAFRPWGWYINI